MRYIATLIIALLAASPKIPVLLQAIKAGDTSPDGIAAASGMVFGSIFAVFAFAALIQWIWGIVVKKERPKGSFHRRLNWTALIFVILTLLSSAARHNGKSEQKLSIAFLSNMYQSCIKSQPASWTKEQTLSLCQCARDGFRQNVTYDEVEAVMQQNEVQKQPENIKLIHSYNKKMKKLLSECSGKIKI